MKKLLSLILALAMVLALSVCAFASGEPSAEASGEASVEVTNEGLGSYVSYLRQYIADCDDPQFDDGAKEMALGELDTVEMGADVHAFPFDMFVGLWGAMSYEQFMTSRQESASPEPQTEEEYNAYVDYLKDYIRTVDLASVNPDFVEDGREMCINELDGCGFGSDVYAFPFEMIINELKAPTYAEFIASQKAEPQTQEEYDAYVNFLKEYIRTVDLASVNPDFVEDGREMCINELDGCGFGSDVYAFPFEMIINELKAPTYDEFVKTTAAPSGEASR